jgi:Concanavalin A-like lectin/glucanases superfamily
MVLPGVVASAHAAAGGAVRISATGMRYSRSATGLGASDFTFACWVKLQVDRNAFGAIIAADNQPTDSQEFGVNASGTALGVFSSGGDTFQTAGTYDLVVGTWTFIARTFQTAVNGHIYKAVSGAGSLTEATNQPNHTVAIADSWTFCIGADGSPNWVNASIAAVKVWSASLSSSELLTEMATYAPTRTSNLWAAYSFRNGPQTTDDSSNGRTLTQTGTPTLDASGPPIT